MTKESKWPLFRLIVPAFPELNIFTRVANQMTALGPVVVATAASKLWGWRVEVIDENNCKSAPKDENGFVDHRTLQAQNPAEVVGFYCGLSSTIPRVWKLAQFYRAMGATTIAGGWHTHYAPEESLNRGIDIVVHGDGEMVIRQLLNCIAEGKTIENIACISFLDSEDKCRTNTGEVSDGANLNLLPYTDFGLVRFSKIKIYQIGRIRGCSRNCEFCSVKGKPRWASGQFLFDQVQWLVETRKAREFFIVDDRLEEDREGSLFFFDKIAKKYGRSLDFTVQARLEAAKDQEFLVAMGKAGVRVVCIGYESPIDEELQAMRKGYSSKDMIKWTKMYSQLGLLIHAMFIWGYPSKKVSELSISTKERAKRFKKFIRQAHLDTVQILRAIPLIGSELRTRLEQDNRLFPLDVLPWEKYDGNYACFQPRDMSLHELQEIPTKLMRGFYDPMSFFRIALKTLAFPIDYLVRGWDDWHRSWRNDLRKYGGYLIIKRLRKHYKQDDLIKKLENAKHL
ncbi:MAG: cobalamin-dependent protein [Deltaproteobacteria bacterium]|nr:cobalamin-dependent protein [Deltaproteobacteria bacterium]